MPVGGGAAHQRLVRWLSSPTARTTMRPKQRRRTSEAGTFQDTSEPPTVASSHVAEAMEAFADELGGWGSRTRAWVSTWRAALAQGGRHAFDLVARCPLLPDVGACVPTRVLLRSASNLPCRVVHGAPWLVVGTHAACDVRLSSGESVQCVLWTREDASRRSSVYVVDLGGTRPTGVRVPPAGTTPKWCSAIQAALPVDQVACLLAGDARLFLVPMRFRFPRDGTPFDRGEWGSQAPVVAVARRLHVEFDLMASGYWHVCPDFADVHVGWDADAVRRAVRGKTVFVNPPWTRPWGEKVTTFALETHDATSILILPVWPSAPFWERLCRSSRANEVHRWPTKTVGLFAPELHDYSGVVMRGVSSPVSVWRVTPRPVST